MDFPANYDHGPCNDENYGDKELIKDNDGNEILVICSQDNSTGVFKWMKFNNKATESMVFYFTFRVISRMGGCIIVNLASPFKYSPNPTLNLRTPKFTSPILAQIRFSSAK